MQMVLRHPKQIETGVLHHSVLLVYSYLGYKHNEKKPRRAVVP